jgi:hypothetical protein
MKRGRPIEGVGEDEARAIKAIGEVHHTINAFAC